ncbi:INO80 complex subunit B [Elysia marginata]|uniref:INO80 complex subunit B n=1 Tax=Elysia marginata TaxID=1093978 RepID=A0AAV4IT83_9GAST|nr:INO80 complex subunit B [Elysia marginata]
MDYDNDSPSEPPSKRHKKHKKKHKHRRDGSLNSEEQPTPQKSSIKLKLKLGKETMGTKSVTPVVESVSSEISSEGRSSKKNENSDDDISDEEKWLDALEKGSMNSYADIGKKDPSLLTARQKALLHGTQDDLLELPSGYKSVELTEEQKQRRQEKAQKRRQQANEKMENDKNQTVHKLLKKQESKNKRAFKARGGKRSNIPRICYRNTQDMISINLPQDIPFPLAAQVAKPYPEAQRCGVGECTNKRTSVCSKTGIPVCSLQCYKKNLALRASDNVALNEAEGGQARAAVAV